jgi:predicted RNase H-like HicB family nuclease
LSDYHINVFYSEEDGGYIADIPDLEACSAFGFTPEEALTDVAKAKTLGSPRLARPESRFRSRATGRRSTHDRRLDQTRQTRPYASRATARAQNVPPLVPPFALGESNLQECSNPSRPIGKIPAQRDLWRSQSHGLRTSSFEQAHGYGVNRH